MSKPTPPTTKAAKNGKGTVPILPDELTPAVVNAVLEDALLTAAADEAAQTVKPDLEGIPYLGDTRRLLLAQAGFATKDDLRRATVEQIGAVKGVGPVNAGRVKEWLRVQDEMPAVAVATPLPLTGPSASDVASLNQEVQDVFQKLDGATERLKQKVPVPVRDKGLDRQLQKLDTAASELAEGPDTLSAKQMADALKTLDKIAALLEAAASSEKLGPKKQAALVEELRARRKRLQKTLND